MSDQSSEMKSHGSWVMDLERFRDFMGLFFGSIRTPEPELERPVVTNVSTGRKYTCTTMLGILYRQLGTQRSNFQLLGLSPTVSTV